MATTTKKRPSNAVTKKAESVPAVMNIFEEIAGAGFENVSAKDVVIPRMTILQALSPQIKKKAAEYIEGAEAGMFCNVATGDVFEETIKVIPCHFETRYLEWAPRSTGKGLVRDHGSDGDCLELNATQKENDAGVLKWITPAGNEIIETATYHCVLIKPDGSFEKVFLPLSSTALKASRKWMTMLTNEKVEGRNGMFNPPIFWRAWDVFVTEESKGEDDWFGWRFQAAEESRAIDPSGALAQLCYDYHNSVKGGETTADYSDTKAPASDVEDAEEM